MPKRNSKHMTEPGIAKMAKAPKGKRIERFDSGADGLCLRITDRGTKTWAISYHFPDEDGQLRHHRYTIGAWPAIGVAEARDKARLVKSQVKTGIDPKATREAAREKERTEAKTKTRKTFMVIAENYIALEVPGLKRGSESESLIRKILIPEWGDRQASKLEPGDLYIVNNWRWGHGRDEYTNSDKGERFLRGCYAGLDGLLSTLRVLGRGPT